MFQRQFLIAVHEIIDLIQVIVALKHVKRLLPIPKYPYLTDER